MLILEINFDAILEGQASFVEEDRWVPQGRDDF
jgi:hypothetical protein